MWECDMDDGPTVYSWSEQVARKEYKCCECKCLILKGEKYFKAKGLWEGKWSTYLQHLKCLEACMYVRDKIEFGTCIGFGMLMDWYSDSKLWLKEHKNDEKVKPIRKMLAGIL